MSNEDRVYSNRFWKITLTTAAGILAGLYLIGSSLYDDSGNAYQGYGRNNLKWESGLALSVLSTIFGVRALSRNK